MLYVYAAAAVVLQWQNWLAATENWFTKPEVFTIWLLAENNGYSKLHANFPKPNGMLVVFLLVNKSSEYRWVKRARWGQMAREIFWLPDEEVQFLLVAVTCLGCMPVSSAPRQLLASTLSELPLQRAMFYRNHSREKNLFLHSLLALRGYEILSLCSPFPPAPALTSGTFLTEKVVLSVKGSRMGLLLAQLLGM